MQDKPVPAELSLDFIYADRAAAETGTVAD
jgi:hypothetical protein